MDRKYDVITFSSKNPYFKTAWGSHFLLASSKFWPRLLKQSLKTQEKLVELEVMYLNGIFLDIAKFAEFQ